VKRLLITGADGFVGRWLTREALGEGWHVVAAVGPGGAPPSAWLASAEQAQVTTVEADLTVPADLARVAREPVDAVIHLAGVASGAAALRDPAHAMAVNVSASTGLVEALIRAGQHPRLLFVSTGEVYGGGYDTPIAESSPLRPVSPYAESKAAAEVALLAMGQFHHLDIVIARAFPHSGPGQDTRFVLPAFAARIHEAGITGRHAVPVGNLDVIRDFLDVRDVVRAYLLLVARGEAGTAYNVSSGTGRHLEQCFARLAALLGVPAVAVPDASLVRSADIPVLIGDATRLHVATGWTPAISFDQTLQDLVNAQAH
jgi:GDP-4-dehydro-6-deoxy-D-mannose reductase